MDRCDPEQEGITGPPIHSIRWVIQQEASALIIQHLNLCPFNRLEIEQRMRSQENRFYALIGFMAGAGLLGGATGAWFFKALGG